MIHAQQHIQALVRRSSSLYRNCTKNISNKYFHTWIREAVLKEMELVCIFWMLPAILIVVSSTALGKVYGCEHPHEIYISECQFCYHICLQDAEDPKTTRCGRTTGGALCYDPLDRVGHYTKEYCESCVKKFIKYYKMQVGEYTFSNILVEKNSIVLCKLFYCTPQHRSRSCPAGAQSTLWHKLLH